MMRCDAEFRSIKWTSSSVLLSQRVPTELGDGHLCGPLQCRGRALLPGVHLQVIVDVVRSCQYIVSKQYVLVGSAFGDITADVTGQRRRRRLVVGVGGTGVSITDGRVRTRVLGSGRARVRTWSEHVQSIYDAVSVAVGGRHELE